MPELPEVETIRRGLKPLIIGREIKSIKVYEPKTFIGDPTLVQNHKIGSINRRGKAFLINLDNNHTLIIHLRMTGQLILVGEDRFAGGHPNDSFLNDLPDKHTRVEFILSDNAHLFFNDQRKFGFVKLLPTPDVFKEKFFQTLGPEPLTDDLKPNEFFDRLQKHPNTTIKAALLDQSIIAGVGNIYADESLFFAKVHPARKVSTITKKEAALILDGIRKTMNESLEAGGSTLKNYVRADGTKGDYLDLFAQVFNKTDQPCPRCNTKIIKTRVAGRGTHLCPNCQKL